MTELFSSAWSYLSGGGGASEAGSGGGSRFVGQMVDLGGGNKLRVKKVIAEGGYGYVFIAEDVKTGKDYALKRQVVAKENVKAIKQEIAFLKLLSGHPHIIQFVAAAGAPPSHTTHGSAEFLIQTELCTGGQMEDIVASVVLSPKQVLRVFFQTCLAVAHLHSQNPPIVHRDLKVENLLLDSEGVLKLCDFGSATTKQIHPDHSWTSVQRGLAEDEIQRNTTPMYRSPEMIDLYSNHPVNQKADVWALGCLLYKLCYRQHPFEDSAKLRILSANYKIPAEDTRYTTFHGIIRGCLVADPMQRPLVDALIAHLYSVADQLGENLDKPMSEPLISQPTTLDTSASTPTVAPDSELDADGGGVSAALQSTGQQAQKLFGYMREGAGSIFKNIKDSSSKMVQGVGSVRRTALDVTYITSRILVMSFPHEDTSHANSLDEVEAFLESRHPSQFLVFNLSGQSYDTARLNNQVADFSWPNRQVPELERIVDLCRSLDSWLRADPQNVIVIHCQDGRTTTSVAVAAYLLFLGAFLSPSVPFKLFSFKTAPDLPPIFGTPSQLRYLDYVADLVGEGEGKPHSYSVFLNTIRLTTVPLFNAIKRGCKPFVEVFQEGARLFTSATQDTMDSIDSFTSDDRGVQIPVGVSVRGNVMVVLHHIRAIPIARKAGVGMTAVRMFHFQFHTGFISPDATTFILEREELDGSAARRADKFPAPFQVIVEVEVNRSDRSGSDEGRAVSWQNLPHPRASPLTCFSSHVEEEEVLKQFGALDRSQAARRRKNFVGSAVTTQPKPAPAPHTVPRNEESTSVGGNHFAGQQQGREAEQQEVGEDVQGLLSWEGGEESGYVPFKDEGESSSSSSSSSDSEEEEEFDPRASGPFASAEEGGTFANFGVFSESGGRGSEQVVRNGGVGMRTTNKPSEPKLIELSFSELGDEGGDSQPQPQPPKVPSHASGPSTDPFAGFDPWKGSSAAETDDILKFGDSDDFSQLSMASEVRTVGAETFKAPKTSPSAHFDPFGPSVGSTGDPLLDLFGATPLHPSPSNPVLPTMDPQQPLNPNFLAPSFPGSSPFSSKRSASVPTIAMAPNYHQGYRPPLGMTTTTAAFTPTLGTIQGHSSYHSTVGSTGQPFTSAAAGQTSATQQWGGSGGSSPYYSGTPSPRASPIPFGSGGVATQPQPSRSSHAPSDPFADLGNIKGTTKTAGKPSQVPPANRPGFQPMTNRPTYRVYGSSQPQQPQRQHRSNVGAGGGARDRSPSPSGVIGGRDERGPRMKTGVRPNLAADQFSDLLNVQGFSSPNKDKGPRSLKDMKKKTGIEQAVDPDRAKVAAWAEGKERNIRALIGSLHTILWEGETRWSQVGIHQLVQPDQVKKYYRKACLSVHPDKAQGTDHDNLARAIFDELNDAYARFEESGSRALVF